MTDDQRVGTHRGMPYLWGNLRQQMVNYSNAQVPVNNCCPSRSTFLTGATSNETKVWDNTNAGSPGAGCGSTRAASRTVRSPSR